MENQKLSRKYGRYLELLEDVKLHMEYQKVVFDKPDGNHIVNRCNKLGLISIKSDRCAREMIWRKLTEIFNLQRRLSPKSLAKLIKHINGRRVTLEEFENTLQEIENNWNLNPEDMAYVTLGDYPRNMNQYQSQDGIYSFPKVCTFKGDLERGKDGGYALYFRSSEAGLFYVGLKKAIGLAMDDLEYVNDCDSHFLKRGCASLNQIWDKRSPNSYMDKYFSIKIFKGLKIVISFDSPEVLRLLNDKLREKSNLISR